MPGVQRRAIACPANPPVSQLYPSRHRSSRHPHSGRRNRTARIVVPSAETQCESVGKEFSAGARLEGRRTENRATDLVVTAIGDIESVFFKGTTLMRDCRGASPLQLRQRTL